MQKMILTLLIMFLMTSCASVEMGSKPQPTNTLSPDQYMNSCKEVTDAVYTGQISFMGVTPGLTQAEDVFNLVGKPNSRYGYEEYGLAFQDWSWDFFSFLIFDNIVEEIYIYNNEYFLNLQNLVDKYGCPDEIFVIEPGDENTEGKIIFFYWQLGLKVIFEGLLINSNTDPITIVYFHPSNTRDEYFTRHPILKDMYVGPAPWDSIVVGH